MWKKSSKKNKWDKERKSSLKSNTRLVLSQIKYRNVFAILCKSWDLEMTDRKQKWETKDREIEICEWALVLRLRYSTSWQTGSSRNNAMVKILLACFLHKYFYPLAACWSWRPRWWRGWWWWRGPRAPAGGQDAWSLQHTMIMMTVIFWLEKEGGVYSSIHPWPTDEQGLCHSALVSLK